jgi:TRAP-type C4-dicarboxylate transport system substrate-binding protein
MRKAVVFEETAQIAKLESLGMQVTRPDLKAFRALMGPAYKKIGTYAGDDNVKTFLKMVEDERQK